MLTDAQIAEIRAKVARVKKPNTRGLARHICEVVVPALLADRRELREVLAMLAEVERRIKTLAWRIEDWMREDEASGE